ncbi:MAG: hypothetical protein ACLFO5_00625 [Opitutales bacterium]
MPAARVPGSGGASEARGTVQSGVTGKVISESQGREKAAFILTGLYEPRLRAVSDNPWRVGHRP